jgi:hypothetical protein
MRQNAYQASLNKIKVNGKLSVSDLKWSDITDDFN